MDKDYVVRGLKLTSEGTVCLEEFYKHLKKWFKQYNYDVAEKEFKELKDGRNLRILWEADKKVSDYIKYFIQVAMEIDDIEEVEDDKKNLCTCTINLTFNGIIGKDYEDKWKQGGVSKFIKETFDKFSAKENMDKCKSELTEHVKKLKTEIKAYLNLRKS